jgi:hypothetical protein
MSPEEKAELSSSPLGSVTSSSIVSTSFLIAFIAFLGFN